MTVIGGRTQRRYVKEGEAWVVEYGPGVTSQETAALEELLRSERSLVAEED